MKNRSLTDDEGFADVVRDYKDGLPVLGGCRSIVEVIRVYPLK